MQIHDAMSNKAYLTWALNQEGDLVHVDEVPNGNDCGCVCPHCKSRLCAKNGGSKKEHHFAHYSGSDCPGARMTTLHLLAQQIIEREKIIMLPDYQGEFFFKATKQITFDEIRLEEPHGSLRPDCIGIKKDRENNEHPLWIEILVTHEVDEHKQRTIKEEKVSCVEIDLSDMLKTDYSIESITKRLFEEKKDRRWINCPKYDDINYQNKIKYEQEEAEKARKEKEQQKKEEAERVQIEIARKEKERALREKVNTWFIDGNPDVSNFFVAEIDREPFYKNVQYGEETKNVLFGALVPNRDFLFYIDHSIKNTASLQLFYTLLHYYYDQTSSTVFSQLKQRLRKYQYKQTSLSKEEKIHLEELISLRIIYLLEKERMRFMSLNNLCKTIIKRYIREEKTRNEVLMVSSVYFHHIVGSNAQSFGELTWDIIQHHPHLANSYLTLIKSQDMYPNNYCLGNRNMLDELTSFVNDNDIPSNESVDAILRTCFSYAFKNEKRKWDENNQTPKEEKMI